MALVLTGTLTFTADQVVLTNTTGDYHVSNNPGGYGTPNPAFSDKSHYAIIRKKNVNEVDDDDLTLDSYDFGTAEEFTTDRDRDGWFQGVLLDIAIWDSGTNYTGGGPSTTGSVVEDGGVVYYCTVSNINNQPSLNPSKWATVSDLATIEENSTIVSVVVNQSTAYDADVYWGQQVADRAQRGEDPDNADNKLNVRLDKIERYITNVNVCNELGNHTDAEWNVLRLRALGAKEV